MSGWVKIHRSLLDWEWYGNINVCRVFLHLLLTANFEDRNWQGQTIRRGELVISLPNLAAETGLTVKQVRGALDKLKRTHDIELKGHTSYSLITVVNYSKWQDGEDEEGQTKGTLEGRQRADKGQTEGTQQGRQRATPKESKNQEYNNNIYNISSLRSDIFTVPPVSEGQSEKVKKEYKFDGKVIRLLSEHYDKWQEAFPNLNLYAELVSRDDWLVTRTLEEQKKWFPSTAAALNKKNQEKAPKQAMNIWDAYKANGISFEESK